MWQSDNIYTVAWVRGDIKNVVNSVSCLENTQNVSYDTGYRPTQAQAAFNLFHRNACHRLTLCHCCLATHDTLGWFGFQHNSKWFLQCVQLGRVKKSCCECIRLFCFSGQVSLWPLQLTVECMAERVKVMVNVYWLMSQFNNIVIHFIPHG